MAKIEKENKRSNLKNNDKSFFWVTDKEEKSEIRKTLTKDFVIEYINYCSKKELQDIVTIINNIGLVKISAERILEPDYRIYDMDSVVSFIEGTPIEGNGFFKPFMESEEFREQVQLPENRFSFISMGYLSFVEFMHQLIKSIILLDTKELRVDTIDEYKEQVKDNIKQQLEKVNEKNENFLLTYTMMECLDKKDTFIMVFNFDKFIFSIFNIRFDKEMPYLYENDNEITKDIIDKPLQDEFNNIINNYKNLKRRTLQVRQDYYNKILVVLRSIIKNYMSNQEKVVDCSICQQKFRRRVNLDTNSGYCLACNNLIDLILRIKGKFKNVDYFSNDNQKTLDKKRKSAAKSLLKEKDKRQQFCKNILKNLEKSKINNKKSLMAEFKKNVKEVLSINL